ncbi:MAG: gamma carbonic anhydrase family protein [Candidatus Krumholzibacteriota bacterium]|nr:gamma carbonic anhydrase family protein [Candidatus Krumholzibacteriota bacterium]
MIEPFQGISPVIGSDVYIAGSASVIGEVTIGNRSSVWHGAVVRGDCWKISIGESTNIQDCCVCHVTTGGPPLIIGDNVTVGHGAVLHSCMIGNGSLIGMGAVVLDGAEIGEGSIIAANSVVLENTVIPPGSLVAGVPGSVKKKIDADSRSRLVEQAREYHQLALSYLGSGNFSR